MVDKSCVTINEVGLFGQAHLRASTPLKDVKGVKKTRLYQSDRTIFTDNMPTAGFTTNYNSAPNNDISDHYAPAVGQSVNGRPNEKYSA